MEFQQKYSTIESNSFKDFLSIPNFMDNYQQLKIPNLAGCVDMFI